MISVLKVGSYPVSFRLEDRVEEFKMKYGEISPCEAKNRAWRKFQHEYYLKKVRGEKSLGCKVNIRILVTDKFDLFRRTSSI